MSVVLHRRGPPRERRLRTRFPHVLVLDWQPEGAVADDRTYGARVAGRDDLAVVTEFAVRHVSCGGSTSAEKAGAADDDERALLAEALKGQARRGVGVRPHRIRLRAFGPFAGEVEVDLDALAADGLLLFRAERGAAPARRRCSTASASRCSAGCRGCAAGPGRLHPTAPTPLSGARGHARGRSRRWRITRSPAQERPKARGQGTTTEQARIRLEARFLRGGQWTTVSTRIEQEAAAEASSTPCSG